MNKNVIVAILLCVFYGSQIRADHAPGHPGHAFPWASPQKQGLGTSYHPYGSKRAPSRVWFTIADGTVTEVYYPRIDTVQTRDMQFLVTDGKSFLHEESKNMRSEVKRITGSLAYEIVSRDYENRYQIKKTIFTDPHSDTLVTSVVFTANVEGLQLYVLHNPTTAGTVFGDHAEREPLIVGQAHPQFGAWQGLYSTAPWGKRSVGYVGVSDGYQDLARNFSLDHQYDFAGPGNVAITAQIGIPEKSGSHHFDLYLYFEPHREAAVKRAYSKNWLDAEKSLQNYIEGWRGYLETLRFPRHVHSNTKRRDLLEMSALVLKGSEDKTHRGAVIAGLSHPWGNKNIQGEGADPYHQQGYHVVWPRDLYHIAGGFLSVGDTETAVAILDRFREIQYQEDDGWYNFGPRSRKKAGAFPQNLWTFGRTVWDGYQADQTAQPIILTYKLWKQGLIDLGDYAHMVRLAGDFLAEMGPWTHQERWEENHGISPNTGGFVIAAMVVGSEMALALGDAKRGTLWLSLADQWALKTGDNLDTWTFTESGNIGNGKYYVRVDGGQVNKEGGTVWDALWNPNDGNILRIANRGWEYQFHKESSIIDGGFLELVRLGVRSARNYFIRESIPELDAKIRVDTPHGSGWYRYNEDGYGENGKGRLWPFLTGERVQYELQLALETGTQNYWNRLAPLIQSFENFSNEHGIFSEQVWDEGSLSGRPDGSATPLTWAHAEYLQVVKALETGVLPESLDCVRARYGAF